MIERIPVSKNTKFNGKVRIIKPADPKKLKAYKDQLKKKNATNNKQFNKNPFKIPY